jgi:hypothetical protein
MTRDEKQAKAYNAEYDGFEVRYADGSWKLYEKYGNAINAMRRHMGACKLVGHKLSLDSLNTIETILAEKR